MPITLRNHNFAKSRLAAPITNVATTLSLVTGEGARFPSSGLFRAVIWGASFVTPLDDANREIVTASLSSGDTFTITRSQEGTASKAWGTADHFAHVVTAGKIDEIEQSVVLKDTPTTIDAQHIFNPPVARAPFTLGANAAGQLVSGLRADIGSVMLAGAYTLNGRTGLTITHNRGNTNYTVKVSPVGLFAFEKVGDISYVKAANTVVIYNSGGPGYTADVEITSMV